MMMLMTRPAEELEPTPTTEPDARVPLAERAEQLAERVKADAREHAEAYLRETVVREGGE